MLSDTISSVATLQYLSIEDINDNINDDQTGGNQTQKGIKKNNIANFSDTSKDNNDLKYYTLYKKYKSKYLDLKQKLNIN